MGRVVYGRRAGWRRNVQLVGLSGAGLYLLARVGCASFQRKLIYFPQVLSSPQVEALGRAAGLERWLDSAGQPLGWKRLAASQPARGQVLILHGNAGCAFLRLPLEVATRRCSQWPRPIPDAAKRNGSSRRQWN